MFERLYICNTYYQVYISIIKEMNTRKMPNFIKADIMLTDVATDFKNLNERLEKLNIFENIISFHEPDHATLAPIEKANLGKGNFIKKIITKILYSRKITKEIDKIVSFDFKKYPEIYMYDDPDPLGYYFYKHNIHYIAIEDALNVYQRDLLAGEKKLWFFRYILFKLHLIYIPCAHAPNALKVEVNDKNGVTCVPRNKIVESPRENLIDNLTEDEKNQIFYTFEYCFDKENHAIDGKKTLLIIAQCLYPELVDSLDEQIKIYRRIVDRFKDEYIIFLKPHPRDKLDYSRNFDDIILLGKYYPLEILNFKSEFKYDLAVTLNSTAIDGIAIAREKISYGSIENFWQEEI